ncbi:hypothetical protein DFJ58DRAFT_160788 [Suillus subalutaceus]|uniref:uncharacterized protein n=1 Tax=Suillus subalutaceus TaxID=48586 RepID=UPI001B869741|nr:uncharacterized protein DFJ58DRAFT_160788 [Suillus subalutaceus]KAG1836835.1 hypothetical protein DFJ58DRAFT_160788 [Suillus subalutaceus]
MSCSCTDFSICSSTASLTVLRRTVMVNVIRISPRRNTRRSTGKCSTSSKIPSRTNITALDCQHNFENGPKPDGPKISSSTAALWRRDMTTSRLFWTKPLYSALFTYPVVAFLLIRHLLLPTVMCFRVSVIRDSIYVICGYATVLSEKNMYNEQCLHNSHFLSGL